MQPKTIYGLLPSNIVLPLCLLLLPDAVFAQRARLSFEGTLNGTISAEFNVGVINEPVSGFIEFNTGDPIVRSTVRDDTVTTIFDLNSAPRFEVFAGGNSITLIGSLEAFVRDEPAGQTARNDEFFVSGGGRPKGNYEDLAISNLLVNGAVDTRTFVSLGAFPFFNSEALDSAELSQVFSLEVGQPFSLGFAVPATGLGGGTVVVTSIAAIPEPTTVAFLTCFASVLTLCRRRKC